MQKFVVIENLRAWMAWWVVLGHALHLTRVNELLPDFPYSGTLFYAMERGDIAVAVFIIVSGFVITHLYLSKEEPYPLYLSRRLLRIYPIYVFCVVLALVARDFYIIAYTEFDWVYGADFRAERIQLEQDHALLHGLLHLTMLHGVVPDTILPFASSSILSPAWSLSLEWQFYLVAPFLIAPLALGGGRAVGLGLALLAVGVAFTAQQHLEWRYMSVLPLAFGYFLVGIASRLLVVSLAQGGIRLSHLVILGAACLLCEGPAIAIWLVFFAFSLHESGLAKTSSPILIAVSRGFFQNARIATIGSWSYSTYLVHIPIYAILIGTYVTVFGREAFSQQISAILIFSSFPLILLISWALYEFVERPFIRLGRTTGRLVVNEAKGGD